MSAARLSVARQQLQLMGDHPAEHPVVAALDGHSSALEAQAPILPPRGQVHAQALELIALAKRAEEFSRAGRADLVLALRQLEQMRAILGEGGHGS